MTPFELLCAAIMLVGLLGVVVQVLPGTFLVVGAILLWATESQSATGWVVLGIAVLAAAAAWVGKYLLAGRGLKKAAVPHRTLVVGGVLGVIGFFVIPVIGLIIGGVIGIYAMEFRRTGDGAAAWSTTKTLLVGFGLGVLLELGAGILMVIVWIVWVLTN